MQNRGCFGSVIVFISVHGLGLRVLADQGIWIFNLCCLNEIRIVVCLKMQKIAQQGWTIIWGSSRHGGLGLGGGGYGASGCE